MNPHRQKRSQRKVKNSAQNNGTTLPESRSWRRFPSPVGPAKLQCLLLTNRPRWSEIAPLQKVASAYDGSLSKMWLVAVPLPPGLSLYLVIVALGLSSRNTMFASPEHGT